MDIKLNKNWRIKTLDKNNLVLEEQGSTMGYFSNLQDALESYLDQRIMRMEAKSVQELIQNVENFRREVQELLKPLKLKIIEEK